MEVSGQLHVLTALPQGKSLRAEVMNTLSFTSTPPLRLHGAVLKLSTGTSYLTLTVVRKPFLTKCPVRCLRLKIAGLFQKAASSSGYIASNDNMVFVNNQLEMLRKEAGVA
jgi:hypothetical protein